jgi:hypothetical protein
MKEYAREICLIFAEKYPRSAAFSGGRRLRIGQWEKIFPNIKKSFEAKDAFLESAEWLAEQKILEIKWMSFRTHDEVDAIYLLDAHKLYAYVGLLHPAQIDAEILEIVAGILPKTDISVHFYDFINEHPGTVRELLGACKPAQLKTALALLTDMFVLSNTTKEVCIRQPVRQLSVVLFHNSKRIEQLLGFMQRIADKAGAGGSQTGPHLNAKNPFSTGSDREEDKITVSKELGLQRSYPEVSCLLSGVFHFSDGTLLHPGGRMLTLPLQSVTGLDQYIPSCKEEHILLLENKESFYSASSGTDPFTGYLYLGGFPNSAAAILIKKLAEASQRISCFCDLDPAGILIAEKVQQIAGTFVDFFKMDVETYETYRQYGYQLSSNELKKLSSSTDPHFTSLIEAIRAHGVGVEQEIVRGLTPK